MKSKRDDPLVFLFFTGFGETRQDQSEQAAQETVGLEEECLCLSTGVFDAVGTDTL